ncbi:hypothetical protein ABPG73_007139, partial [Tetrahymena malaccensis]
VQFYKSIIKSANNIQVFIEIDPNNPFNLISQLTNFSFKSLISLTISSNSDQQLATIQYEDSLIFEDYNSINLFNIQVVFLNTNINQCGLEFSNIQNIVQINNIQLQAYQNPSISCQRIKIINSYVQIQNYTIYQENFSNSDYIFSTLNTNQISISNFTLVNCQFGDNFSILQQNTDVQAIVQNIKIENNFCQQDNSVIQTPTALFSAGHYTVSSVLIQNNTFCNKNIFQAITSIKHLSQTFSFQNVSLNSNKFLTRTNYLLFNCFYSILSEPSHQFILQNSSFYNNSLFTQTQSDLKGVSLIQTDKIQNITLQNVDLIDHFDIQLGAFVESSFISIYNFNCSNNQVFLKQLKDQQTQGCIVINEATLVIFDNVQANFKKAQDNSLFLISNSNYKSSQVNISNIQFTNLILNQTSMNTFANPFQIIGSYQINLNIQNSQFINNSLISLQYSLTYSTSGLWFENFVGQAIIYNTTFENNYSNSIYNNIHIQSDSLIIDLCTFKNSTFTEITLYENNYKQLFSQQGGMINGIVNSLIINNSLFQQSTASIGSFLYIQAFGNNLNIFIRTTKFIEGYGQIDGGAMYINPINNLLNFSCTDCEFTNIYSLNELSSQIQIIQQNQKNGTNNITFIGGIIQTIQGISDNYFIKATFSQIEMIGISQITNQNRQQSTFIYSQYSQLIINNCNISNLSITNYQSSIPLIIQSQNSTITISSTSISNCEFSKNMVQLNGGKLILDNILFNNIQSYIPTQILSNDQLLKPSSNQNSVIATSDTYIQIQNNSSFSNLTCLNCNGGLLQILNGSMNIQNSLFYSIKSNYGGVFFIIELYGTNNILNSQFQNCQSIFDGGVAYVQFNSGNIEGEVWQKQFSKSAKYSCAECEKMKDNTWIILGLTSWTLFSMMIAIRGNINYLKIETIQNNIKLMTIKKMQKFKNDESVNQSRQKNISFSNQLHNYFQNKQPKSKKTNKKTNLSNLNDQMKQSIYIKMFTNYFQIVSSIATFNLTIPSGIFEFPQSVGQPINLPKIQTPFSNANLKKSDKLDSEKNSYILEQDADLIFNSVKTNNFQTLEQRLSKEAQKQQNKFTIQNTEIPNSPFLSIFELDDPIFDYDLEVYSFLRIPMTNILLINTIDLDNQSQSIVYYADLSSPSKSIINVVKHHSSDVDVYFKYQYFSQIYNFTCLANQVIISSNEGGIIAWGINLDTMEATYYGVIDYSKLDFLIQKTKLSLLNIKAKSNYQSYYNRFEKYPDQDILFIGGQNYELTAIKVLQFQKGQYKKMMHTYLFRGTVSTYIENIMFQYVQTNQQNQTVLFVADRDQINYLELNVDLQNNIISAPLDYNPDYWNVVSYFQWYHMQGTSQIYMSYSTSPMNTSSFQINWENIGNNFDPFYYNNYTWIVVAFPNKNNLTFEVNGLFYLINAQNTSEYYALTSPDQNYNIQNTSFAVASIEDLNNPEIIGVDTKGNVYSWDLLSPTYNFKFSLQLQRCFNSQIGEIFQYNQNKKLIIFCDDYSIYSFDLQTSDQQFLLTLTSIPISIRAFNSIQMIAIPDFISGILYLYKYNIKTNIFVYHLTLSESQLPDYLYHVELLRDNTLWVQYKYSFVFYQIDTCLDNPISCTNCQQNYFFNITNNANDIGIYGQGNFVDPYTTSQSYFQAIINAQYYSSIITDVINIQVLIEINPKNLLFLNPQLFEFRNKQIIQLTLKSTSDSQLATIICQNALLFDGYNNIKLYDIQILFLNANQNCGIQFSNINSTVIINNIQLVAYQNPQISCQSIIINNSQIQVQRYVINSENFTNNNFIFQTQNSNEINITNLSLVNCQFGEQFSILQQNTDLNATLQNILLQNNYCSQNNPVESNPTSLFSAGHYSVSSVLIINNTFCNKNIFQTVASIKHSNQTFSFQNISMLNNQFLSRTLYLLLESMYSVLSDPSHQLLFYDCKFQNNSLFQKSQRDLNGSSLVQTNKIQNVILQNITFIDHIDILLGTFEYLQQISVNNFNCSNDIEYLQAFYDGQTQGCIQINEATSIQLESLQVNHKKAQDNSLILISNYNYKQSQISINNSNFTNLILNQTQKNTFANPIQIIGSFQINLNIQNNLFTNNALSSLQFSLTYSTTGLWFENFQGSITILNSTFDNNFSNSIFNNLHLQSNATAFSGSFLYIKSFGQNLNIFISSTQFTEGYSQIDGGAIYIDPQTNLINFTCIQCEFKNIYSFSKQSSSIYMMQLNQLPGINNVTFIGGIIQTIQGIQDNYFIKVTYTQLTLTDIPQLTHESFSSKEMPFLIYQRQLNQQQSSLIYLENSQLFMKNCNISNLSIKNVQSTSPLIVYSLNSNVTIVSSSISNCQYIQNLMFLQGGLLEFNNIQLNNIQNNLQFKIDQQVQSNLNSIILAQNSKISILNNSSFYQLQCIRCYGGFLQIINGNINIQNSSFRQISSYQGGVFFINGLHGNNSIKNATFQDCQSQQNAGVSYISLQDGIQTNLNIDSTNFINNTSIYGRGGAVYVSTQNINPLYINFNINNTIFKNNFAQIGAAVFQQNISLLIQNSFFVNNQAQIFGRDEISYPSKLKLVFTEQFNYIFDSQQYDDSLQVMNFRSGDVLTSIHFQMVNDLDEIIFPVNYEEYKTYSLKVKISHYMQNLESYLIDGDLFVNYDKLSKSFTFPKLKIIGIPGSSLKIQFFSDQIYVLNKQTNKFEQNYTFDFEINFRNCISGEYQEQYNKLIQCSICQKDTYSFNFQPCQKCPVGGECIGGDKIYTQQGYWRKSEDSILIINCENQISNCVGGSYANYICQEGHIGALCEECDIHGDYWGKNYSKSAKYSCAMCEKMQFNIWIILGLTIWTFISLLITIRANINYLKIKENQNNIQTLKKEGKTNDNQVCDTFSTIKIVSFSNQVQKFAQDRSQKKKMIDLKNLNDQMKQSIYIKMFTNYFQIVSSIASFNFALPADSSSRYTMSVSFIIAQYNIHINITFFISFKYMIVPRLDQGQYVQNVVKIPNTNIMVVNTLQYQNQDKSIVYFVDMTIPSGSIVQIIQPPYVILQLIYAYKTNQFLITNYNNIIVADIFTLSPINILFYENIWNISHIQNSDLVILTAKYQFLYIFDLVKMNVVQTLQNNDPQFPQLIQYQSQLYALSLGIQLIITSTNQYLYGWIVDSTSYKPILQKQISGTNFTASTTSQFQVFAKEPSPSQDIIFYSTIGTNQISSFLIKNDQLDINQEGTYSIQNTSELIAQIFCFDSTQIYIVSNNQLFTVAFTISQQSLSFTQNSEAYLFQDTKQKITQAYYDGYHFIIVSQDTSALYNRISLIQQSNHAQIPNILYFDTKIGYRQFIYESSPNSNSNVVYYGLFSQNNLFKVYIRSNNTQNQINQQNQQVNLPQQLTIFDNSSSLYPVKNKLYSIIIKAQDNNNKPYIVIIDQTDLTIQKLDPFCFNSNYYMIIYSSGYFLIQIDGNQSFQISTSSTVLDQNSIFVISTQSQKVYAINSQKIIIWKINSIITSAPEDDAIPLSKLQINSTISQYIFKIGNCDKPLIAEEFQQSQGYILIISCQNQSLLYYDLNTKNSGTIQLNSQAQEAALFIKSFSILLNQQSLNILVLGGNKSNNVYILQFNQNTGKFEIILTITSGQLQDIPNYVDLLSDQTLWIQYKYSNLFYPLQNCLLSPNNCQNCQFKVTISEQPQSNQDTLNYGANNSYYTGSSILVALLQAKYYQAIQPLQTQISLELDITAATIPTNYFNFDKSSITSLNIKSSTSSTSIISYQGQIVFNQYTSITISNIQFKFTSSQYPNCGLVFQNVTSISFTPISITTDSQNQNCYNVIANSTVSSSKFQITGMTIQNLDFTNNNQIILSNGYDIQIDSLNLSGCTLGDNFSIITQTQGNYINLSNSYIQSNKCVSNWSSGTIASALFKGSQIIVKSLQILDNTFCNKLIFQSLQFNLGNQDQIANLDTITIKNNQFATISPTVFYYTFQQQPQNIILLNQLTFEKNTINSISKLPYATYISLFNIQTVTVTIVNINQEYSFQFTNMTSINSLTFTNINFINDPNFQSSTPLNNIPSCFQLYEIQNANLNTIKASYKNSVDQPLILIKNIQVQNSQISFSSGEFQNLNLNQPSFNTNASPIQISSVFQLNLTIDGIVFQNNNLIVNSFPSVYSASALWIENQQGNNTIQNSQFLNTYSNSHYNFIFCFGNNVTINTCTFQNSSFVAPPQTNLFVQRGGMIHIKTSNLNIYQSTFTQATAFKGSFMYVKSVGNPTLVNIQQTKFTEGYAFLDGGAFYFDNLGVQLNFTCQNCIFKNIFTMYMGAAVIGFEPQGNIQIKDLNQITLDGGSILNMYGVQDNSFIETYYAKIKISNIQNIGVVSETPSQSAAYSQYQQMQQQQTSILNILNGEATIQNCGISNFQIKNSDSTYSLFVTAVNSNITLDTVVIQDSLFYQNAFQITKGSTLNLINTKITNVNQYVQSSRLLQSLVPTYTPSQQSYSLIEVDGSTLNISNNSLISKIVCKSICNGIIQITNSSMNADSSTISLSQSNFGGAIFVRSFTGTNNWNSLTLDSNSASYDGGALYFSALTTDKFKLTLNQCTISNNKSINGRGGGMYITSQVSNSPNQSIVLKDTQILNNNAKVGGGMQYTNISPQIKGNTVFKGNKAFYFGSDSFSYPSHLYLQNYTQANNQVIINQFRSGGPLNNLTFEFQNDKNEKILPVSLLDIQSYSIQVQIDPNNQNFTKYTIRGDDTIFYSLKTQSFTFSQLIFVGTPGTTVNIQFKSDQIQILDKDTNTFLNNYAFNMLINFRACESGEEIVDYNQLVECVICPKGSYSFHIEPCVNCPDGATCNGGNNVTANQGYWRKKFDSVLVESCYNLPANCPGGTYGNNICFEGHIGALCEECDTYGDFWGTNYSKASDYACTRCDQIKGNLWFVFIMTAWTMISMTLAIKGNIDILKERAAMISIQKKIKARKLSTVSSINSKASKAQKQPEYNFVEDKSPIFIKMLTNYFQIVGVVSQFNISIPTGIFNVPNSVGSPLKSSLNSLDCALLNIGGNLPMVYLRLIFSMFLPIIYFTLFIGGITLIFYINKYRSAKKEKQQEKQKADEKNKNNQLELDIKNKEKQNHELFEDSSPKKDENQSSVKQKDFQIEMKNQNEIQQNQNNEVQEQKYKLKGDTEQNLDIKNQSQRKSVLNCFKKKPPKKFEPKTKERLRSIFQKYLDMDDQQRKKLFVNVFEKHIDDKYQGSYKSKQNTKNMIISSQISSSGKNSHSNLQHEDNEDIIIPSEKNQQDIQIKHQDTKNLTSVYNLLQRYPTESTPVNYNPSPFQHYNSNHQEEEASKQINLN